MEPTFIESYGAGENIIGFSHANGFLPGAYAKFFSCFLDRYTIYAHRARPLWAHKRPPTSVSWRLLASDYYDAISNSVKSPMVGIGHSMGGVFQLFAALQRPELFRALVLIEPVLIPITNWFFLSFYQFFLRFFITGTKGMVETALNRQSIFESKDDVFDNYRQKKVFSLFPDSILRDYIESAFHDVDDGTVQLIYPKEWEAAIYNSKLADFIPLWQGIETLRMPVYILKAEHKSVVFPTTVKLLNKKQPSWKIDTVPGVSHLMPFENPEYVAGLIQKWLNNI